MSGRVNQFSKNKGYEAVPREVLQSNSLSRAAKGLLLELKSYSENWVLHKTELYTRNSEDGRTATERQWDELVRKGYIIQFRKRTGKKYIYEYFFTTEKFTLEDIQEIRLEMIKLGYLFYLKPSMEKELKKELEIDEKYELSEYELSCMIWDVENQQSNKNTGTSTFVEMLILDSPKRASKRTYNKREDDDEYNINKGDESFENQVAKKAKEKDKIEEANLVSGLLTKSGVDNSDALKILDAILDEPELIHAESIVSQLRWCVMKNKNEGISNLPTYFLNGLRMKLKNVSMKNDYDFQRSFAELMSDGDSGDIEEIPLHDWTKRN